MNGALNLPFISMSARFNAAVIIFLVLSTAACASRSKQHGFEEVQGLVAERITQTVQWNRGSEDDERAAAAVAELLRRPMSCEDALQVGLLQNPTLQAQYEELGIAQADLVQAGLLKNPVFDAELHFKGSGIGMGTNLNVFQDFIDILQLPSRRRIAAENFESAKYVLADSIVNYAAELKTACVSLQAAEALRDAHRAADHAADAALEYATGLHRAGSMSDREFSREASQAARVRIDAMRAESALTLAREALALLMGISSPNLEWSVVPGPPKIPEAELSLKELEPVAPVHRFDLLASRHAIEASAQKADMTESYRLIPEFTLGVDLEGEEDGGVLVGPNFQVPLPVFDQGTARVDAAHALVRKHQREYQALALKAASEIRRARAQLVTARAAVEYIDRSYLPAIHSARTHTMDAYNSMLVSTFDLLQTTAAESEAKRARVEALRDYWTARIELERALGGTLNPRSKDEGNSNSMERK